MRRPPRPTTSFEQVVAYIVAQGAYFFAIFGLIYACAVL